MDKCACAPEPWPTNGRLLEVCEGLGCRLFMAWQVRLGRNKEFKAIISTHAVIDTVPKVKILSRAMCLSCSIALDSVRACLRREGEHQPDIPILRYPLIIPYTAAIPLRSETCSAPQSEGKKCSRSFLTMLLRVHQLYRIGQNPLPTSGFASVSEYSTLQR